MSGSDFTNTAVVATTPAAAMIVANMPTVFMMVLLGRAVLPPLWVAKIVGAAPSAWPYPSLAIEY